MLEKITKKALKTNDMYVQETNRQETLKQEPTKRLEKKKNIVEMSSSSIPDVIHKLAPIVALHPREWKFPMDPMRFIFSSRFRHHIGIGRDEGYNKDSRKWEKTDTRRPRPQWYGIPVNVINSYGLHPDGKNRRPRDPNNKDEFTVFLQPDGEPGGNSRPNHKVPTFFHWNTYSNGTIVQYWFFFGYNSTGTDVSHQGDWESVSVWSQKGRVVGAYLSAHGEKKYYTRDKLKLKGERVVAFCSHGTHAFYPSPGKRRYTYLLVPWWDKSSAYGYQWHTSTFLVPLRDQPWKDYAGAWGEVGYIKESTGPLGPWHKLLPSTYAASRSIRLYQKNRYEGHYIDLSYPNRSSNLGDIKGLSAIYDVPDGKTLVLYEDTQYRGTASLVIVGPRKGRFRSLREVSSVDRISSMKWMTTNRVQPYIYLRGSTNPNDYRRPQSYTIWIVRIPPGTWPPGVFPNRQTRYTIRRGERVRIKIPSEPPRRRGEPSGIYLVTAIMKSVRVRAGETWEIYRRREAPYHQLARKL